MRTRSQRLLSMVLALSMLLTFLPVSAFAEGTPPPYAVSNADTPTLDENNTYTDNGNTYTYSLNTADHTATLTKFTGTNADVPEKVTKGDDTYTVTAIGAVAFATKRTVTSSKPQYTQTVYDPIYQLMSVKLPNTITVIGDHAFASCVNIQSIEIPDSVTEIKESAFESCSSLGSVDLSKNLTTIGDHAFASCEKIQTIKIPDSVTEIETGTFGYCTSLNSVTLPKHLTTIGMGAFVMCAFESITLPKSLNTVGYTAFGSHPNPITTVTYTGTKTDWDNLVNSPNFDKSNTQLTDATLHCAHTVTFNVGEHGTAPDPQVVQYDEKAEKPDDPTANGFTFKGWYTESEGGEKFNFENSPITKDETLYAHWVEDKKPDPTPEQPGTQQPGTTTPTTPPESTGKPTDKPNDPTTPAQPSTPEKPNEPTTPEQPGTPEKPNEPTPPEAPAVEEDDTAAIGYAAAAVTAAFVGWGAYRIGSEVYLKYLLPKDVLLPQNRIQLAKLLWEDAGRPAPADAAAYTDVDANDADAQQAARWAVENGLLTLPDTEKPEEFAPYRSVSYAKSARAWNQAQQLKENAAAR